MQGPRPSRERAMSSSGRSGEGRRRRPTTDQAPADNDDQAPRFFPINPQRSGHPSPPVVSSDVPFAVRSGDYMFHFDPSNGSVRRTPLAESPPSDRGHEILLNQYFGSPVETESPERRMDSDIFAEFFGNWSTESPRRRMDSDIFAEFFGTSPSAATSPWRAYSSSATVSAGTGHTNRGRNETLRAAPDGEGSNKKSSAERSAGTTSGGGNRPSKREASSGSRATSAPPPHRLSPEQINRNDDDTDAQDEEEEEVLQESKLLLGMPQNPHYRPLLNHPKSLRQHLIASYDKSLVDVGSRIQKLTPAEFKRSKEDMRGALKQLEKMGYSVGPLTRRLDALEEVAEKAAREGNEARQKKEEARRKRVEKEEELTELKAELRRLQIKIEEKQEGIEELQKWESELDERVPDVEAVFARMARTPLAV